MPTMTKHAVQEHLAFLEDHLQFITRLADTEENFGGFSKRERVIILMSDIAMCHSFLRDGILCPVTPTTVDAALGINPTGRSGLSDPEPQSVRPSRSRLGDADDRVILESDTQRVIIDFDFGEAERLLADDSSN